VGQAERFAGKGHWRLKPQLVCPHGGSCLQKVMSRSAVGHGQILKFAVRWANIGLPKGSNFYAFIDKTRRGLDVVSGWRKERKDTGILAAIRFEGSSNWQSDSVRAEAGELIRQVQLRNFENLPRFPRRATHQFLVGLLYPPLHFFRLRIAYHWSGHASGFLLLSQKLRNWFFINLSSAPVSR
jgi:hypothetical protein